MGVLGENLGCEQDLLFASSGSEDVADQPSNGPEKILRDRITDAVGEQQSGSSPDREAQFDFSLKIKNASLQLYEDGFYDEASAYVDKAALARLDIIDSTLSFASYDNGLPFGDLSTTTMYCRAIKIHDSSGRVDGSGNIFTHVLRPIGGDHSSDDKSPPLLQVTYRSEPFFAKLYVVLSKIRVVVPPVPWLQRIKDWLFELPQSQLKLQEMINDGLTDAPKSVKERDDKAEHPRKMDISVSVTDPEFIVVEDRARRDTNAVVLKFCSVLKYNYVPYQMRDQAPDLRHGETSIGEYDESTLTSVLERLDLFSCKLDNEATTALSIVDPCIVNLESRRRVYANQDKGVTDVNVDVSALNDQAFSCRLSYRDFRLFSSISNGVVAELKTSQEAEGQWASQRPWSVLSAGENLRRLLEMDFPIAASVVALQRSAGAMERAAIWLCNNPEPAIPVASTTHNTSYQSTLSLFPVDSPRNSMATVMKTIHAPAVSAGVGLLTKRTRTQTSLLSGPLDQHGSEKDEGDLNSKFWSAAHSKGFHEDLHLLTSLGFSIDDCQRALTHAKGEIEEAAIWLVDNDKTGGSAGFEDTHKSLRVRTVSESSFKAGGSFSVDDTWDESRSRCEKVALMWRATSMSFCMIDDCMGRDQPLVEFKLENALTQATQTLVGSDVQMTLQCDGAISCDYYNGNLSTWEPFMEPWPLTISLDSNGKPNNSITARVEAQSRLELNLTSVFSRNMVSTLQNWSSDFQENKPLTERTQFVPYKIRNSTGCNAKFYRIFGNSSRSPGANLAANEEIGIDFAEEGWSKQRRIGTRHRIVHKVAIKVDGWHDIQPDVAVDRVGTFVYYPKPERSERKPARVVVSVSVEDGYKLINVQSALKVCNCLGIPIDLRLELALNQKEDFPILHPGKTMHIPLHLTGGALKFRPHGWGHQWTSTALAWENFDTHDQDSLTVSCRAIGDTHATDPAESTFQCCVGILRQEYPPVPRHVTGVPCPRHTISLLAPLTVENLLPYQLEYHIANHRRLSSHEVGQHTTAGGDLAAGCHESTYAIDYSEDLSISIKILGFRWSEPAVISDPSNWRIGDKVIRLVDNTGRALVLELTNSRLHDASGARHITLHAPYWIVNHTSLPLQYKQANRSHLTAGMNGAESNHRSPEPFIFSCDGESLSSGNKLKVRILDQSAWGADIPIDSVGCVGTHSITSNTTSKVYEFGVEVNRGCGKFNVTKIISLLPRYVIVNSTDGNLQFIQGGVFDSTDQLDPGCSVPFHWPRSDVPHRMCVRASINDKRAQWSTSFPISDVGTLHVKQQTNRSLQGHILRVEVRHIGATLQVVFSNADKVPPFRINNESLVHIQYHQEGLPDQLGTIRPKSSVPYAWDDFSQELALVVCVKGAPYKTAQSYDLYRIHEGDTLLYPQHFFIIGPEGKVLGNNPTRSSTESMIPCLCDRQPRDPMQLWQASRRGQLWNMANYVLELHSGSPTGVRLRKIQKDSLPSDRQCWTFEGNKLINQTSPSGPMVLVPGQDGVKCQVVPAFSPAAEKSFTRKYSPPGCGRLSVRVCAEGPTRVLTIKDADVDAAAVAGSWDMVNGQGSTINMSQVSFDGRPSSGEEEVALMNFDIKLDMPAGTGVSLVDNDMELLYCSTKDIQLTVKGTSNTQSLELSVQHLQIDNQMELEDNRSGVLYPQATAAGSPPNFQLTVVRSLEGTDSADVFKLIEVDIQPFFLTLEETLLLRVLAMQRKMRPQDADNTDNCVEDLHATTQQSYQHGEVERPSKAWRSTYFEVLRLNELRTNISLVTSPHVPPALVELKQELGLSAITQFQDAVIHLDALLLERPFAGLQALLGMIQEHYTQEVLRQVLKIIGSADFLGNPIGILNHTAMGMKEFVSEVTGGNVVSGGISLAAHMTHGLADSASKLTGSISSGLGAVTMDKEYQISQARERSADKDFAGHLASGVEGLGRGIFYGLTGVVTQPVQGLKRSGVGGFLSGAFQGAVGAVVKPVAGAFDLVSATTAAVRHSAGQGKRRVLRVRPPRAIGPDLAIRIYRRDDAVGWMLLLRLNRGYAWHALSLLVLPAPSLFGYHFWLEPDNEFWHCW